MKNLLKRNNRTNFDIAFDWSVNIIGVIILILVAYPLYFVLIASFSDPIEVANGKAWFLPSKVTLMGYEKIFEDVRIWTGYRNTTFYTFAGTVFSLFGTLPAAFALSRKEMPFRGIIMFFFAFTMFFSGGLVPTYFVIKDLGMVDTPWVMIIPFSVGVYNVIITRTFFQYNIPEELVEAAKIDGCNYTRFFIQIVMPLSKAIIAVMALYYAVGYWNEYFRALIYIKDKKLIPLQIVLRDILIANQAFEKTTMDSATKQRLADIIKYGLIIVATLPIMMVYPFIQKYFTKGVMIGSIKG